MNALSSILNWIGGVIGANPNTLTTSSKTIVGAINEVDADISAINSKGVASFLSPSGSAVDFGTSTDNKTIVLAYNNGTSETDYTVTNDGKVKIVNTGKYLISAMFGFSDLTTDALHTLTSGIGKVDASALDSFGMSHMGSYLSCTYAPRVFSLTANDVIYPFARNNSGNGGKFSWAIMTIQRLA